MTPTPPLDNIYSSLPSTRSNELHVYVKPISKIYTNDIGRFPLRSCIGNQYIIMAYHCDCNVLLVKPFQSCHDRHH